MQGTGGSDRQLMARVQVFPEKKDASRDTPVLVCAERTRAQDLDGVLHSIWPLPDLLCVRGTVDVGGNVSILGQPSKKFKSLLDLGSVNDHPISGVQNRADTR